MGRNGNRLHGNGREWEFKKPFPVISTVDALCRDINRQGGGDRTLSGSRGFGYGLKLAAGPPGNMTSSCRLSCCVSSRTDRQSANVGPFGCIRCVMES